MTRRGRTGISKLRYTDIHQHIVCGVDDGAKDFKTSVAMLEECVRQGIVNVICTSHIRSNSTQKDHTAYCINFDELVAYVEEKKLPLTLFQGSEVFYSEESIHQLKNGVACTLGNSRRVLVEFQPCVGFETLKSSVNALYNEGYMPVLAHIERVDCLKDLKRIDYLRSKYEVMTQMNAGTVISAGRLFGSRFIKKAIKSGLVDLIGSDAHNLSSRKVNIKKAAQVLSGMVGSDMTRKMCYGNARAILLGEKD